MYFIDYNNDVHNPASRANQKDIAMRMQQFFDNKLMGKPAPDWMVHGIPYVAKGKDQLAPRRCRRARSRRRSAKQRTRLSGYSGLALRLHGDVTFGVAGSFYCSESAPSTCQLPTRPSFAHTTPDFPMADEIDYKLIGDDLQAVIITLDPGEMVHRRSRRDDVHAGRHRDEHDARSERAGRGQGGG